MTQQNDKPQTRLDDMLRRWGAEEAVERARVPSVPGAAMREIHPAAPPAGRYFLIGAAAGLLFAVAGVFILKQFSLTFEFTPHPAQVAGAKHEEPTSFEVPTAMILPDANHVGPAVAARGAGGIGATTRDGIADLQARVEEYRARIAALEQLQESHDRQFASISQTLKNAQDDNARMRVLLKDANALAAKYDAAEKRLSAAAGELARIRKMSDEQQQARDKALAEIASASAHRDSLLLDMQRAMLGEDVTLKSRQDVARRQKLVDRCSELRKVAAAEASQKLLDKLEVVLLRLSMLDAADKSSADTFAKLIRENDLVRQIDQTLASGAEGASMRTWLLEVRCVLMGADHVA